MNRNSANRMCNKLKRLAFVIPLIFSAAHADAQVKQKTESAPPPHNLKVLEEHKDAKGNIIRKIQYEQGGNRVVETMVIHPKPNLNLHPINPDTINKDSVVLVINKSNYNLEVYYRKKLIRYYKAVFGPKPLENKKMEGDRCTPEGWFSIKNKNPNSKYDKFLQLNYPNDSSVSLFNRLKERGALPATARIGGDVGIHGIWKGGDDMIENRVCWTDGCVAIKNKDVEELYNLVGVGTRVYIRK
jgi:lipoprotein-anchoring transpeptidase ErfK/SrfK